MFLEQTRAAGFIDKPSDAMMFFIIFVCALFFFWIMCRGGSISESANTDETTHAEVPAEASDEDEEIETSPEEDSGVVSIDPGIIFVGKGYLVTVGLIVLGILLIMGFQGLYPGH